MNVRTALAATAFAAVQAFDEEQAANVAVPGACIVLSQVTNYDL